MDIFSASLGGLVALVLRPAPLLHAPSEAPNIRAWRNGNPNLSIRRCCDSVVSNCTHQNRGLALDVRYSDCRDSTFHIDQTLQKSLFVSIGSVYLDERPAKRKPPQK